MEILTEKQEAVLNFIENYQLRNGRSPTLREMRENFGVISDNSILKHLHALEEKGYITKDSSSRGIAPLASVKERLLQDSVQIPILGFVPAGGPTLSEEYVEGHMSFSSEDVFKPDKSFILASAGTA